MNIITSVFSSTDTNLRMLRHCSSSVTTHTHTSNHTKLTQPSRNTAKRSLSCLGCDCIFIVFYLTLSSETAITLKVLMSPQDKLLCVCVAAIRLPPFICLMDEDLSPLKTQRARSLHVHGDPLISLSGPSAPPPRRVLGEKASVKVS